MEPQALEWVWPHTSAHDDADDWQSLISPTDFPSEAIEEEVEADEPPDLGRDPDWLEDPYHGREEEDCVSDPGSVSDSKQVKNLKERERMRQKRLLLDELESLLKSSSLISQENKKKRLPEAYIVSQTISLIMNLEAQVVRQGRKRLLHHPPPLRQGTPKKNKKPSNSFINFSAHYRPCFVHVMKGATVDYGRVKKNPSQKIVQKVASRVWRRLEDKNKWEDLSVETVMMLARDCLE